MWIWILIIAIVIGAIFGFASSGKGEDAAAGAMAGGCMAASCLGRIFFAGIIILLILWLFSVLLG